MRGAGAWARRAAAALFPALTLAAAVWLWPLLFKLGNRTLCLADWEGFCEEALRPLPGGCLHFAAGFLSALWAVPWLGWAVFVAAGLGMAAWAWRSGRTPRWWGLLPFAATLCCLAWRGAAGWPLLGGAAPFALLLGWCVCLLVLALARAVGGWAALAAAALYPLAGAPALLAALVALTLPRLSLPSRLLFAAVLFLPLAWRRFVAADAAWEPLLLANAPFLATDAAQALNHANLLCLILVAGAVWWAYLPQGVLRLRLGLWVPPLAFAAAIALSPAAARACPALPAASTHETEALP